MHAPLQVRLVELKGIYEVQRGESVAHVCLILRSIAALQPADRRRVRRKGLGNVHACLRLAAAHVIVLVGGCSSAAGFAGVFFV
jgi:hypothetical protein